MDRSGTTPCEPSVAWSPASHANVAESPIAANEARLYTVVGENISPGALTAVRSNDWEFHEPIFELFLAIRRALISWAAGAGLRYRRVGEVNPTWAVHSDT